MNLKCQRCEYGWDYQGNNKYYATCPHCLTKVRVRTVESFKEKLKKQGSVSSQVAVAIKNGTIKREPCIVCGQIENTVAHHEDYDKPLEITWLCREHHMVIEKITTRKTLESAVVYADKCPKCGQGNIVKSGITLRRSGNVQSFRCNDCAHIFIVR